MKPTEEVEHDGSDWGAPPETQAMRDARIRREIMEACAKEWDTDAEEWLSLGEREVAYGAHCCAEHIRAMLTLESGVMTGSANREPAANLGSPSTPGGGSKEPGTSLESGALDALQIIQRDRDVWKQRALMRDEACSFEEGAAFAFGIMGMAEAIRRKHFVPNCPICKKSIKEPYWTKKRWVCHSPCSWNLEALEKL